MPAQSWANPKQLDFLNGKRVEFSKAQREKRLPAFWSAVRQEFFVLWPNQASEIVPMPEGTLKKKKKNSPTVRADKEIMTEEQWVEMRGDNIYHWFNNHALNKGRRAGKVNTVKITAASSSSRVSTLPHLYSKKYYESRVKEQVDQELANKNMDEGQRLTTINKILTRIFEDESPEVKEEIREMQEQERRAREEAKGIDKRLADGETLTAEQLLVGQSTLPDVIQDFCDAMNERTGWWFTVLAGGPDPSQAAHIRTYSVSTGEDKYGRTFARAYPEFNEGVLKPFSNFLQTGFSKDARERFRFGAKSGKLSSEELEPKVGTPEAPVAHTDPAGIEPPAQLPSTVNSVSPITDAQTNTSTNEPTSSTTSPAVVTLPMTSSTSTIADAETVSSIKQPTPSATSHLTDPGPLAQVPLRTTSHQGLPEPVSLQPQSVEEPTLFATGLTYPPLQPTFRQELAEPQSHLFQPQMSSQGVGISQGVPQSFPLYFDQNWNGMGGYNQPGYGRTGYGLGEQSFGDGFNDRAEGFNMLGQTHEMWQLAQNPGEFGMADWNFGGTPNGVDTAVHHPTEHLLPSSSIAVPNVNPAISRPTEHLPPSSSIAMPNVSQALIQAATGAVDHPLPTTSSIVVPKVAQTLIQAATGTIEIGLEVNRQPVEELGTRVRKPTARKEVVALTEVTKSEGDGILEWMALGIEYLKKDMAHSRGWLECVDAWVKFEKKIGLQISTSHRNFVKSRPDLLSKWLLSRKYDSIPEIADKRAFGSTWRTWWNAVQPKWRQASTDGSLPSSLSLAKNGDNLNTLKKGGASGLLIILTGLKWWAPSLTADDEWEDAVRDIASCLGLMTNSGRGLKRKGDEENKAKPKKKRK